MVTFDVGRAWRRRSCRSDSGWDGLLVSHKDALSTGERTPASAGWSAGVEVGDQRIDDAEGIAIRSAAADE